MTPEQFLKINQKIGESPPDIVIRKEVLINEFKSLGLTKNSGYKAVQYYYNELCNIRDGKESVFEGKCIKDKDSFCLIDHFRAYFKMKYKNFSRLRVLFTRKGSLIR